MSRLKDTRNVRVVQGIERWLKHYNWELDDLARETDFAAAYLDNVLDTLRNGGRKVPNEVLERVAFAFGYHHHRDGPDIDDIIDFLENGPGQNFP